MSHRIVFESIGQREGVLQGDRIAYTYHEDFMFLWDQTRRIGGRALGDQCGFFLTYGDGMVQHSHESAVVVDNIEDYLGSLAAYLLSGKAEEHDWEILVRRWPDRRYSRIRKQVAFYAVLKYRDDKRIYYHAGDLKVSGADSKRHDKRWVEVESWMDGSFAAVCRLVGGSEGMPSGAIERYALANAVAEEFREIDGYVPYAACEKAIGLCEDRADRVHLTQAFDTVSHLVESHRQLEYAKRQFGCWMHNAIENKKKREEVAA